ncbi:hypothetical protein [Candidatus Protochlamydia phocaeensis]|uniref:hypothetical protein n=1 Tax=Candidatus Protochlamydia phocaeensis TaxID=1414722 RepID=UPI00083835C6|nr:hypothetical protein [Candidatus Protochlamydia phocaeensis]
MIELTFNTALMLYLSLALLIVLGVWVYSHYRTRRRTILSCEQDLFVCEYCHYAYLEESIKQLNRCPQCGLYNKHNQYQTLRKKSL